MKGNRKIFFGSRSGICATDYRVGGRSFFEGRRLALARTNPYNWFNGGGALNFLITLSLDPKSGVYWPKC